MPQPTRTGAGARRVALVAASLTIWLPHAALAWGQTGHRVVAEIAQRHLEPAALARVTELLEGRSLAEVSTWPDDVRSFPEWDCAQPFHFVTMATGAQYPDQGVAEGDAIQAVLYYAQILADRRAELERRRVAFKFLIHLVGDLHQPLHVGRGCDRGGNQIKVEWFEETVSFHSVWDEKLVDSEKLSFTEFADFADHATAGELISYQASTPVDWARESQAALDGAYTCDVRGDRCPCFCGGCEDGLSAFGGCVTRECSLIAAGPVRMAYQYKSRSMPVIYAQVVKGGARLAGMLGWIFADDPQPPEAYRQLLDTMRELPNWQQAEQAMASCDGSP